MDNEFHNTGVGYRKGTHVFSDPGLAGIGFERETGLFLTPSLRDVARTAPYMHDGSIATIKEVVAFYNKGGIRNPYLDSHIKPLHLRRQEIDDLVNFLNALTGTEDFPESGESLEQNHQ